MNKLTCLHGNGPECAKCEALDIPEVEDMELDIATLRRQNAALQEDADRARWCEEAKAQVSWSIMQKAWRVLWDSDIHGYRQVSHADRNAAIDSARGKA